MDKKYKYDAFISYSHKDKAYVSIIQKSIETLGLPFYKKWKSDINIFRDERKIPLAGSLTQEILKGLQNSKYLIVIASKNSASSTWVKEEINRWLEFNKDSDGYIVNFNFILIDNVIEWDNINKDFNRLKTTALPSFDKKIFKDLPIWANLQNYCNNNIVLTKNANYEWEIAKIKALILNKKPDEIIDEASKAKRLFRGMLGVIICTLVLLTAISFYQRDIALDEKEKAKTEANANYLLSLSLKHEKENPELAMRLLSMAYNKSKSPAITNTIYSWFLNKSFNNNRDPNAKGKEFYFKKEPAGTCSCVNTIGFTQDGQALVCGSGTNCITATGSHHLVGCSDRDGYLYKLDGGDPLNIKSIGYNYITHAQASENGKLILLATNLIYNSKGKLIYNFDRKSESVIAISPKGNYVFTSTIDNKLHLYNHKGNKLHDFSGLIEEAISACFSQNEEYILVGFKEYNAKLFNINGKLLQKMDNHDEAVSNVYILPDSNTIVTQSNSLYFWDINGKRKKILNNISGEVVFSPKNNQFLQHTYNSILLYDLEGHLLKTYNENESAILKATFSKDSKFIITAHSNTKIRYLPNILTLQEFVASNQLKKFSKYDLLIAGVEFDINDLSNVADTTTLKKISSFYFSKSINTFDEPKRKQLFKDTQSLYEKLYSLSNKGEYLMYLFEIYEHLDLPFDFNRIASVKDTTLLSQYGRYFLQKARTSKNHNNEIKYTEMGVKLYDILRKTSRNLAINNEASEAYYRLATYYFLNKQFDKSVNAAEKSVSIQYEGRYLFPRTGISMEDQSCRMFRILAPAYLYNEQLDKAKEIYLQQKDYSYSYARVETGYPNFAEGAWYGDPYTFKDIFIEDFDNFTKRGIPKSIYSDAIIDLLSGSEKELKGATLDSQKKLIQSNNPYDLQDYGEYYTNQVSESDPSYRQYIECAFKLLSKSFALQKEVHAKYSLSNSFLKLNSDNIDYNFNSVIAQKIVSLRRDVYRKYPNPIAGDELVVAMSNLVWYQLGAKNYVDAMKLGEDALKIESTGKWAKSLYVNLGHAYLLNSKYTESIALYNKIKEEQYNENGFNSYGDVILSDLKKLKENTNNQRLIDEALKYLTKDTSKFLTKK